MKRLLMKRRRDQAKKLPTQQQPSRDAQRQQIINGQECARAYYAWQTEKIREKRELESVQNITKKQHEDAALCLLAHETLEPPSDHTPATLKQPSKRKRSETPALGTTPPHHIVDAAQKERDERTIRQAARNGAPLLVRDETMFVPQCTDPSYMQLINLFEQIAKLNVTIDENGNKIAPINGISDKMVGGGTYCVVWAGSQKEEYNLFKAEVVYRRNLPDDGLSFVDVCDELALTVALSRSRLGAKLYAAEIYEVSRKEGPRTYGITTVLERATQDVYGLLHCMHVDVQTRNFALNIYRIMSAVSSMCIFVLDIKPANMLQMTDASLALCDPDPRFMRDASSWGNVTEACLLINVLLFTAQVANDRRASQNVKQVFVHTLAPLLKSLLSLARAAHNTPKSERSEQQRALACIHEVRALPVEFDDPRVTTTREESEFEMQHQLVKMVWAYFYNRKDAKMFEWQGWPCKKSGDSAQLARHWKEPQNRRSWPATWQTNNAGLLELLFNATLWAAGL